MFVRAVPSSLWYDYEAVDSVLCELFPVAVSPGDNSSTATNIKWNVDPAQYATGKVIVSVAGHSNEGSRSMAVSSSTQIGGYSDIRQGAGTVEYVIPFTVATV